MKKLKIKTEMLRKKRSSHKAVESVLRPERFVKTVGLEPAGSEKERELWMVRVVS